MKRIADILLSVLLGLLSLPLCIFIFIAIKLNDGGRIIYSSQRIGLGGRRFNMLKFKTMNHQSVCLSEIQQLEFQHNFKLNNDDRVTKVGRWLRRYSFDEIPQFLNVLKGDVSIIGPRPKLPEEIDLYGSSKNTLLSVLPGMTGYWQVYRTNANSDEIMRRMDLYYIRNRTLTMDIKILLRTFLMLISRRNY